MPVHHYTDDEWIAKIEAAHKKVAYFPEDQADGWAQMIALRNLVPEALRIIREQKAQLERLGAVPIEEKGGACDFPARGPKTEGPCDP